VQVDGDDDDDDGNNDNLVLWRRIWLIIVIIFKNPISSFAGDAGGLRNFVFCVVINIPGTVDVAWRK